MSTTNAQEFKPQQTRELKKLLGRLPKLPLPVGGAEKFVIQYVGFEAVARKIWHYYRCRSKVKKASTAGIPIDALKKACTYFGIDVEESFLNLLLDSRLTKRGSKSARNLRNELVHSWGEPGCKEVRSRETEFETAINKFLVIAEKTVKKQRPY